MSKFPQFPCVNLVQIDMDLSSEGLKSCQRYRPSSNLSNLSGCILSGQVFYPVAFYPTSFYPVSFYPTFALSGCSLSDSNFIRLCFIRADILSGCILSDFVLSGCILSDICFIRLQFIRLGCKISENDIYPDIPDIQEQPGCKLTTPGRGQRSGSTVSKP